MSQSEEERFRMLYRTHRAAITAYVRRRVPAEAVEDIVADIFLGVLAAARPRACGCASVAVRGRAEDRRERSAIDAPAFAPPRPADDPVLAYAFAALSERDREILCLVAWEDLALNQAAEVLGCSPVAARVRFQRARRRLAKLLAATEQKAAPQPLPEGSPAWSLTRSS